MGRDLDDIFTPLDPGNPTLAAPLPRRWSLTTLLAARPNPKFDIRARAEQWNREYDDFGRDIPQLLVNPADFPVSHPEPTPEQVERNWERLKRLSDEFKL
jgi:hypothetical protein